MDYTFNVELAEQYGVEQAVLLQHLCFWIQKNAANQKHFYDGQYWTYNSAQAFTVIFPFWNRQKIDRLIQSLREQGAIITGNYNKTGQDRTRWFALSESVQSIAQNRAIHCSELSNPLLKSEQPLPDNNTGVLTGVKTYKQNSAYSKFIKPSFTEVKAYCVERKNGIDAQAFIDHYDSCGWVVGKNKPMVDWRASIRTWENNRKKPNPQGIVKLKIDKESGHLLRFDENNNLIQ